MYGKDGSLASIHSRKPKLSVAKAAPPFLEDVGDAAAAQHLCEHPFVESQIASLGADFQRAVQQGNVMRAEAAARQLGQLPLDQALRLVVLYAEKEPIKFERAALRWLGRYMTEGKAVSLLKAQLALAA